MGNPFNYLQFATGDQFYDRREIRQISTATSTNS